MEIISARHLVTMEGEPIFVGAIAVEHGEIIDVGPEKDIVERYRSATREDFPNHVLMPGLINAHTHLDMTLHKNYPFDPVRQMAVEPNFVEWLISTIEYKKQATHEKLREAVGEGLEACLENGTTCVGDMGSYEGIFQCMEQAGMRAVLFPEVLSYDSYIAKDLYETALALVEKYMEFDSELINVGLGPYSAYTLSRNILKILSQYSRASKIPLMMHVAESFSELEFFYDSTGDIAVKLFPNIGWGEDLPPAFRKTPVEYLHEIGFLDANPLLVGCIHETAADLNRLAEKKAKVIWCPRSNDYLKVGRAPVTEMLKKGILVALGTDGISSTNTLSLWDELRFAFEVLKSSGISAGELLKMATVNGALALGLDKEIGTLSSGKRADYIVVDAAEHPKNGDLLAHLIQFTKNYHVCKVVINGRTVKNIN